MSKSKIRDDYELEEARANRLSRIPKKDRRKEKRIIRALKTKNVDELLHYDESSFIEKGEEDANL